MLDLDIGRIIIITINIIALFLILRWLLFKPVTEVLDKRTEKIRSDLDMAKNNREEADKLKEELNNRLENAKGEAKTIIDSAVAKGLEERAEIVREAKIEADKIIQRAKNEIELERNKAITYLKEEVAVLASMIASKAVEDSISPKKSAELINGVIEGMGESYEKYHR
ncbi:F0F1 ATP synthase subunit B [Alkalicella caledoniensis]|uniref:ATP synthase subunit b n=1 Tax=Alkalicella caledoniensis TaxID=2731377 RepID=A0A7G9W909_ALKCA|nr:F0F1 ATP synthase subunit B [Alkalicella caledoniensis]QNO15171.1 F0F1 ATP synthase subunit B [Alkalicella caledoniensis]